MKSLLPASLGSRSSTVGRLLVAMALATTIGTATARAAVDEPVPEPTPTDSPSLSSTAPHLTNEGLALSQRGDWSAAEVKYRAALRADRSIPEAWNGLGHALKMQARYDAAIAAYDEALRLRPKYPQALEYLGETYVELGKLDQARAVLARLEPLDAGLAAQLSGSIADDTARTASW
jgi:tetratricopeptide (TPR) repeat protein